MKVTLVAGSDIRVQMFDTMIAGCRRRAANKGVAFEISSPWAFNQFFSQNGRCAVSGLEMHLGGGRRSPYLVSIDRRKPALGYTEDNCRLVILAVNIAMNTWGDDVFRCIAMAMANQSAGVADENITTTKTTAYKP